MNLRQADIGFIGNFLLEGGDFSKSGKTYGRFFAEGCVFANLQALYMGPSSLQSEIIFVDPQVLPHQDFKDLNFYKHFNPPYISMVNCKRIATYGNLRLVVERINIYVEIFILEILMRQNLEQLFLIAIIK